MKPVELAERDAAAARACLLGDSPAQVAMHELLDVCPSLHEREKPTAVLC
jgi:hypothetical protein